MQAEPTGETLTIYGIMNSLLDICVLKDAHGGFIHYTTEDGQAHSALSTAGRVFKDILDQECSQSVPVLEATKRAVWRLMQREQGLDDSCDDYDEQKVIEYLGSLKNT